MQEDLDQILPFATLSHLKELDIGDGIVGGESLPNSWSQLSGLTRLQLPRCSFPPSSLTVLPNLGSLTIQTLLRADPLGAEGLWQLVQGLTKLTYLKIMFQAPSSEDAAEFAAEVSGVRQFLPGLHIEGVRSR